ncbi:MAG: hypothetical protein ACLRVN_06620 [Butyricicoccus sp.]
MKRALRPRPRSPILQNWTEETGRRRIQRAVLARFRPPPRSSRAFLLWHGKTYESSKEESYAQSITDTISVPLPAHTGLDINVDVTDLQTTIPYTGAVRIKYKTMLIYVTGCYLDGKSQGHKWYSYKGDGRKSGVYTFGRNGLSAIGIWMPASRTGLSPATTPMVWI